MPLDVYPLMDQLHSLNEAINKRAGRKLIPSIFVGFAILGIVFGALKIDPLIFALVVWLTMLLATREIVRAYKAGGIIIPEFLMYFATTALMWSSWFGRLTGLAVATAIVVPNVMVFLLLASPKDFVKRSTAAAFAIFYVPFLSGFILLIGHDTEPIKKVFTLTVLVSCNDTFAYFSGLLFGKHLLAPSVSPKKTWEGVIGSIFFTTIGATLVFYFILHDKWWLGAMIGVMGVVTATCGDLIESALKRDLHIKDMGAMLPGHGGVLDRVDSLLFTGPSVWFVFELIRHFKI
jgi:phosphatidate cytidylyltransferase